MIPIIISFIPLIIAVLIISILGLIGKNDKTIYKAVKKPTMYVPYVVLLLMLFSSICSAITPAHKMRRAKRAELKCTAYHAPVKKYKSWRKAMSYSGSAKVY